MKELTSIKTMSSREIAKLTSKRHDQAVRVIKDMQRLNLILPPQFVEEKTDAGRRSHYYVFSGEEGKRDSLILVARLSPEFMCKIVDRWMELEKATTAKSPDWSLERLVSKLGYKSMCDAIKASKENPATYDYSNNADLINRIILGMSAKQYKELNELGRKDAIRDKLEAHIIFAYSRLQFENERLIIEGVDFQERKAKLKMLYERLSGKFITAQETRKPELKLIINNA